MNNRILSIFICFLSLLSCKNDNSKDRIKLGNVYFVIENVNTTRAVTCSEFISTFEDLISHIELDDPIFKEQMIYYVDFTNKTEGATTIDVRYRIEFDNIIICIDQHGNYSLNNEYKGKFGGFKLLQKYLEENKGNASKMVLSL